MGEIYGQTCVNYNSVAVNKSFNVRARQELFGIEWLLGRCQFFKINVWPEGNQDNSDIYCREVENKKSERASR